MPTALLGHFHAFTRPQSRALFPHAASGLQSPAQARTRNRAPKAAESGAEAALAAAPAYALQHTLRVFPRAQLTSRRCGCFPATITDSGSCMMQLSAHQGYSSDLPEVLHQGNNRFFGRLNDCPLMRFIARSRIWAGFLSRNLSISMRHPALRNDFSEQPNCSIATSLKYRAGSPTRSGKIRGVKLWKQRVHERRGSSGSAASK